jgi:hypothetical protein
MITIGTTFNYCGLCKVININNSTVTYIDHNNITALIDINVLIKYFKENKKDINDISNETNY